MATNSTSQFTIKKDKKYTKYKIVKNVKQYSTSTTQIQIFVVVQPHIFFTSMKEWNIGNILNIE